MDKENKKFTMKEYEREMEHHNEATILDSIADIKRKYCGIGSVIMI